MSTPLENWVEESAKLTKPDKIHWCDGSDAENARLTDEMLRDGSYIALNEQTYPNCYLHRSNPNDVARTENVTFICTRAKDDAGPTNNWMAPEEAKAKVRPLFDGAMKGRTMYVVPYILGPAASPYSKIGVEITDSAVRRCQHAHHVAHGQDRARPSRQIRGFRSRPAFARRPRSRPPLHPPFSRRKI